jgi:hypothetical protein
VAVHVVGVAVAPDEVPGPDERLAAQVRRAPIAPAPLVGDAAVEQRHHGPAASRRAEPLREGPRLDDVDAVLTEEVPLHPEGRVVRRLGGRVRVPVGDRVVDVRVLAELRDRLAHRVAVVDLELLGAAGKRLHRLGAGLGGHLGRHTAASALLVTDDHLVRHVVARPRGRREGQHQRKRG